jgi:hypothetical protein
MVASVFILVLGGCGSFNNSFNTYSFPLGRTETIRDPHVTPATEEEELASISAPPQQITVETKSTPCTISPYPTPGNPPELPSKALAAANGDVYAIERIERKHIDELRAYISERKRLAREARTYFANHCEVVSKY